jgi:hypothetical protein
VEDKQPSGAITRAVPRYSADFLIFLAGRRGDDGFSVPTYCKILAIEKPDNFDLLLPIFVINAMTDFGWFETKSASAVR